MAKFDRKEFFLHTWPEALESGDYVQISGQLEKCGGYCCLGVACELLSKAGLLERSWPGGRSLPRLARDILGLSPNADYGDYERKSLARDNDNGLSFKEIAQKIREIEANGLWIK